MEIILNSFGCLLTAKNGQFVVENTEGRQQIPPEGIRQIVLMKGATLSNEAAQLAVSHDIDIVFCDAHGMPTARLWSVKFGSISTIRQKQISFAFSPLAVEWIKNVITQKIKNQQSLLQALCHGTPGLQRELQAALRKSNDYLNKIAQLQALCVSDIAPALRGWEGAATKAYFKVLSLLLPEAYRFESRSQHPAKDRFNAVLNYAYGMLYGKIESALIRAGLDPYVGVFHRENYNRPVLVFDVIELFRVWADYVCLYLCRQQAFIDECFLKKEDGSFWLEDLGRRIVIQSMNDYLEEVIEWEGLSRSRSQHLLLYARRLAQYLLDADL
ncbi:MAG: CRISPR-associated protein Cas1 [Thermonema sp.]|jgi:CRISPR-associated protein Cas1|uniref:CRISPR-associated endonuclease Cas1 n=1 Tax=Thermonema sp. TaxID=2231181 RepID=UPI0021DE8ED5|nr:CRISPR-associated endonuclease Cas1 [Thermonema sp.]GIV39386.1 MAG: CRISPR-associated protein Cas1 [Thermonema sp.]